MFRAGIITLSDKGALGEREDKSGPLIHSLLENSTEYLIADEILLPDEQNILEEKLKWMCDELKADLILTTGGTGFSIRDVTPEATAAVAHRMVPGIAEAIRAYSMTITKRAMLSRGIAVIRNQTLIVNLPGSPKAVEESLTYILPQLKHGLEILKGCASECARKESP